MPELGAFQDAFVAALAGDFAALAPYLSDGATAEARFSVHRNTVAKGCADALAAQFPTVLRAAGEAWMRQAAVRFARERPPEAPALADYGQAFPDWLATFPPAAETPWLAGLARIDWAWRDALFAADQPALEPAAFAALAAAAYPATSAELHPAARVLWFERGAPGLWAALQGPYPPETAEIEDRPQGLLIVRPGLEVAHRLLGPGAFALLDACRLGRSLEAAGEAALSAEPDLPLAAVFAELIAAGAFGRLRPRAGADLHEAARGRTLRT